MYGFTDLQDVKFGLNTAYPCFVAQSQRVEGANGKQLPIWRPSHGGYWVVMGGACVQHTTIGVPDLGNNNNTDV